MNISEPRTLQAAAMNALEVGREPKKVILYYAGITAALGLVLTVLGYWIGLSLADATGLDSWDRNITLSFLQLLLPFLSIIAQLVLNLGYLFAMLRIGRKLYADQHALKEGLSRLGAGLRSLLLRIVLYIGVGMALYYPVSMVVLISPMGTAMMQKMENLDTTDMNAILSDQALMESMMQSMLPLMLILVGITLVVMLMLEFRFRMTNLLIADNPRMGAFAALLESTRMLRGNCLKLLKLDLRLWWYHGLILLAGVLAYGAEICALAGIRLPVDMGLAGVIFQFVYLAAVFAVDYFLRNRVEMTYVMFYEALRPRQEKNGVVLGNIFQM